MWQSTSQRWAITVALLLTLGLAVILSIALGVRNLEFSDVLSALQGHTATTEEAVAAARIPRTILGILIGSSLAISGTTMQAITRNPLADPGIFGVLSGAALAVVVSIAFFDIHDPFLTMLIAIAGSATASVFVYFVGSLGAGGATPLKLALAGAAITAAMSSVTTAIILPRQNVMDAFRFWQVGGIAGADWSRMKIGIPLLLIGLCICWLSARNLNSLALGDEVATGLGLNVTTTRAVSALGAVVLCGVATALAGPVGFLGLIVPHLCRALIGTDHRWLMPLAALSGAIIILAADVVGRLVAQPQEIAVGILLPLIGAPVFIAIVRRYKVREL